MRTPATGKNCQHPLAVWRKKRKFNQMDASFELDVSLSTISMIEKGYSVREETVRKINVLTKEEFTFDMYKQHIKGKRKQYTKQ